ncbi:CONDENSIN-2 COMPLEX SUBUNIT G2 [Salix viminalis]|uniref:CONDENSIN-2 COMPLEX SUBUNIT G2 n=1 Tax=Salix viminalis TaxID=40686 RepID=A0A9Q0NYQ0_SALVM|nr:CONDENSIN-2 COMPLEX SUBUNIT G2 [Salix viminalis]
MKEVKDTLLDKQFFLMERLIMDDCPDVRVIAVEGCFRVLHLFWEIIPSSTITKLLTKLFDDMSHDICNEVRLSTVNGIIYLLGNPQSHEILKVLLPRVGHLILDSALSSRAAVMDLLLLIRDIRSFQFNKVVDLDVLLSTLANDHSQVAQKITRLLIPSYFPSKVSIEEACNRCVTLIKRSPMAGARFCEFAMLEGASPKSLMELVRVLISLVLSNEKLHADQIEGLLIAAASLCNNLASEPCYKNALKEFFTGGKVKCLFAVASNGHAQPSVLNICSAVSPDDVAGLVEECMSLVTNCRGLPKDVEMQAKVRSAHRLLLSCGAFDEMFDSLTGLLQKAAYHCHVKFGIEIPKQRISPGKRKKCKSSVKISAKRKHVGGRNPTTFEDDYSITVGIACQIKDLVVSEDSREAILGSQALELSFVALKVISEVSIEHCISCEYMDTSPVLAYSGLALHMSLQNISISTNDYGSKKSEGTESSILETVMDQTVDHLLNCIDKLLREVNIGETQADTSISNGDGSISTKERSMSNKVKMLTAVLKLIVDSIAMGLLSCIHGRCLNFTSAYLKHIIFALEHQSSEKLQFKEDELKDIFLCLKSSFSYAAKLLNLILCDTSETSPLLQEAFDLVNDMLDLITSIELHLGSVFAAGLVASAKSWLPDLILALGYLCMLKDTQVASTYITALDCIKAGYPSWPIILAKTELHEIREANVEEVDDIFSKPEEEEFCVFKKFMETIVSLLKGKFKILDAIGVILLTGSVVGLERKDFGVVLGLLHFVCVKLVGEEDREWNELDMMLDFLPDIYHQIERGIEEQSDENARQKLCSARMLLDHVWFYHIHETGRFSAI